MIEDKQGSEEKLIADLVGRANAQVCVIIYLCVLVGWLHWVNA